LGVVVGEIEEGLIGECEQAIQQSGSFLGQTVQDGGGLPAVGLLHQSPDGAKGDEQATEQQEKADTDTHAGALDVVAA
jgi:hypothetical protein